MHLRFDPSDHIVRWSGPGLFFSSVYVNVSQAHIEAPPTQLTTSVKQAQWITHRLI